MAAQDFASLMWQILTVMLTFVVPCFVLRRLPQLPLRLRTEITSKRLPYISPEHFDV